MTDINSCVTTIYTEYMYFTKNELIIDHFHESQLVISLITRIIVFCSRITENKFCLSRFTAINNRRSRFKENPFLAPFIIGLYILFLFAMIYRKGHIDISNLRRMTNATTVYSLIYVY